MSESNLDNVSKFLDVRNSRLDEIEVANALYIKIGDFLNAATSPKFGEDTYSDGCIYQFFAYIQHILFHFIFNNFNTIIGSYDSKRDCLKSWEIFKLSDDTIASLKTIRARYSEVRNNLLAHLSSSFEPNKYHDVSTLQIKDDIHHLRNILNEVRQSNGIPIVIQGYDADKHYAVEGMKKLFEQLCITSLDTNITEESS